MPTRLYCLFLLLLGATLSGCSLLGMGVEVETVKTTTQPPSDVSVYVTVKNQGEPVAYLTQSDFHIYENDVLLENSEIGFRLLSLDKFATATTVLMLDLSDNPSTDELHRISRGAAHFVEKVTTTQDVIVIAFDGSERPRKVAEFSRVKEESKRPLPELKAFLSKDSSRDLNSALISAAQGLEQNLSGQKSRVQFGTIVTLVRGQDLAGRKTEQDVKDALEGAGYELFSISPEAKSIPELDVIGADGRMEYGSLETLPLRFQDLGMRVRDSWFSHYLLSYCSPARAGTRQVKVRIEFEGNDGTPQSGSSTSEFDASSFKGGCSTKNDTKQESHETPLAEAPPESLQEQSSTSEPEAAPSPPAAKKSHPKRVPPQKAPKTAAPETNAPVVAPPSSGKYE